MSVLKTDIWNHKPLHYKIKQVVETSPVKTVSTCVLHLNYYLTVDPAGIHRWLYRKSSNGPNPLLHVGQSALALLSGISGSTIWGMFSMYNFLYKFWKRETWKIEICTTFTKNTCISTVIKINNTLQTKFKFNFPRPTTFKI